MVTGTGVFVARDHELAQLDAALDAVLRGAGRVRFVVGEAGSGKTALAHEFARRAQLRLDDLIVAVGQSDAQTGIGDPYLPFRDVLALLTGDVEEKLAKGVITEENAGRLRRFLGISGEALVDFGPDLVGTFIPGVGLATRAATYFAKKTGRLKRLEELAEGGSQRADPGRGGIEQSHIFEQYTNVLVHLATQQPLVMVLDDLQWADVASTALLFRLGRSIAESRILVVGTFRPAEVSIGRNGNRHPLEKVLAEFKRYFGDIEIDLGDVGQEERRRLADALLDCEPNRLDDAFRRELFDRTSGHPLFTTELLRAMQERGDLVRDADGFWVEDPSLRWDALPARVEGVIEERIGRLDDDAQETLRVASVEGEQFTAEVVASVRNTEARRVVRRLGRDLEQRHRLVRSEGLRRLSSSGARLSLYGFHHNLFQRYLYGTLGEADRSYLHEDVGNALEALCGSGSDEFVVQLARHFAEGGQTEKAASYLRRAGDQAAARYANDEAAHSYTEALELTPKGDVETRWNILEARERALRLAGTRERQSGDLELLRQLADELDDNGRRAEAAIRSAVLANMTGAYTDAIAAAEEAIRYASVEREVSREARAHIEWGYALMELGQYPEARTRLSHALALAESAALHRIQATGLMRLADIETDIGEFVAASAGYGEALRIFERLDDDVGSASAYNNLGIAKTYRGDLDGGVVCIERALAIARKIGDLSGEGRYVGNLAELAAEREDYAVAEASYNRALAIHDRADDLRGECVTRINLGGLATKLGRFGLAQRHLDRCVEISTRIGHQSMMGHAEAWLGLMFSSRGMYREACDHAKRGLRIAQEISDPRLEAYCLDFLGQGLEGLRRWEEAASAYARSMSIRADIGQGNGEVEAKAGLVRVALRCNDFERAQVLTDDILAHLESGNLDGTERPLAVFLACYRSLVASEDPRAPQILDEAADWLKDHAGRIEDPDLRRVFLEGVPTHRELRELLRSAR